MNDWQSTCLGRRSLPRDRPSSKPKAALRGFYITYALENLKTNNAAWDLRAKALLAVAYCMMARRAELVALRVEDLLFNADDGDVAQQQTMAAVDQGLEMRRDHRHGLPSRPSDCATEPDTMRRVLGNVVPVQEP